VVILRTPHFIKMGRKQKQNKNNANHKGDQSKVAKISSLPTDLIPRPWYPLTVRISTLSVVTLNFDDLFSHLRSQLGLATSNNLRVRLKHIKVWGPIVATSSNTTLGQLHLRFYNPITNSVEQEIIRYPDAVRRSSAGYFYSTTIQNTSVGTLANPIVTFLSPAAAEVSDCVIYVHLLWRYIS